MSNTRFQLDISKSLSKRALARELVSFVEFLVFAGFLVWLWKSEQGRHLWVWMAVGFPLLLAHMFIGRLVRRRLGLIESSPR